MSWGSPGHFFIPAEGVSFPGDLPNVTSVGGTTLHVSRSGGYVGETSWSEPLLSQGSAGGQSMLFAKPSWQRGPGVISSYSDGQPAGEVGNLLARCPMSWQTQLPPPVGPFVIIQNGSPVAEPRWQRRNGLRLPR